MQKRNLHDRTVRIKSELSSRCWEWTKPLANFSKPTPEIRTNKVRVLLSLRRFRVIRDGVELAVAQVEPLSLLAVQGPRAAAPEDGNLVAGFVHGAVSINAFGDG